MFTTGDLLPAYLQPAGQDQLSWVEEKKMMLNSSARMMFAQRWPGIPEPPKGLQEA